MPEPAVARELQANYEAFYRGGNFAEWRRLGAIDKTANILKLCRDVPHDTVLEIGAGSGIQDPTSSSNDSGRNASLPAPG